MLPETFQALILAMRPQFPRLTAANSRPTSPFDESYNCIAWAANELDRWWWPDSQHQSYWPPEIPREVTLDAFIRAFSLQGYTEHSDAAIELGKQKIALYSIGDGKPTHAARQLADGWWTSKLGQQIDIEHDLTALDGPVYGSVARILARPAR